MIDPNGFKPISKKQYAPGFASGKTYFAMLSHPRLLLRGRAVWERASEAEKHAARLQARWIKLYDAWCKLYDDAVAEDVERSKVLA